MQEVHQYHNPSAHHNVCKREPSIQNEKNSSQCVITGESHNIPRQWLPLQGPHDDLDSHLINFERMMVTRNLARRYWVAALLPTLNSKSQAIHARMSLHDCSNYDCLKQALVESFDLGPDEYKRKFRNEVRSFDESFRDFGVRLDHLYSKWRQGHSRSPVLVECKCGIAEEEMMEQYFRMIPRELKILVKDKSPRTLREACKLSDELDRARDKSFSRQPINVPQSDRHLEVPRRHFNSNHFSFHKIPVSPISQRFSRPLNRPVESRFQVPHYRSASSFSLQERKPFNNSSNNHSHNQRSFTPHSRPSNQFSNNTYCSFHKAYIGHSDERCYLNPKNRQPTFNKNPTSNKLSAFVNKFNNRVPNPVHGEFSEIATVNGKEVRYVRDSGSSVSLISPDCLSDYKLTGSNMTITSVFGNTETIPVALVHIKCRYGEINWPVGIVENLPVNMIIGNDLDSSLGKQFKKQCFVVTRSRAKRLETIAEDAENEAEALLNERFNESKIPLSVKEISNTFDLDDVPIINIDGNVIKNAPEFGMLGNINHQQFAADQLSDETLAPMIRKAVDQNPPKDAKEINSFIKRDRLKIYYRYKTQQKVSQLGETFQLKQLLVPLKYRRALLKVAHDDPLSSHQGSKRTILKITSKFFWTGVHKDVEEYVNTCVECQVIGKSQKRNKVPLILTPIVDRPFKRMAMDIVGPLETSKKGNRFILTVIDMHSRFPHAVAMKSVESKKVAEELLKIFSNIGLCEEILSDLGTNFTSQLMKDFCQLLHISQIHSSAYRPQSNGAVERWNGSLKIMLQTGLVNKEKNLWDTLLSYILFAYRSVPQKSTGFSPFEMVYGFPIRTPLDLIKEKWAGKYVEDDVSIVEFVQNMRSNLQIISSIAVDSEKKAKIESKQWYDKKARSVSYEIGDLVFVLLPIKINKLEASWQGPYQIISKQGPVDYVVNFKDKSKAHRLVHVNMLRKFHERVAFFTSSEEIDDDEDIASFPENVNAELTLDSVILDERITFQMRKELFKVLDDYKSIFTDIPGHTHLVKHEIRLTTDQPFRCVPYRVPHNLEAVMKREIETALNLGLIERCSPNINPSPYASPCLTSSQKGWN